MSSSGSNNNMRDKKIARVIEEILTFLLELAYPHPPREAETPHQISAKDAPATGAPEAPTKPPRVLKPGEARMAMLAQGPMVKRNYAQESNDLSPVIRKEARRLAANLVAAIKRGASSNLKPGDRGKAASLIDRKIRGGMSLHKAAKYASERFPVDTRRLEQIYQEFRKRSR